MSKRPDFPKNDLLDFWIFGFLDFFGFLVISWQRKELMEIRCVGTKDEVKRPGGPLDFQLEIYFQKPIIEMS